MHYIIMNSKTDVAKREFIRGPALEVLVPRSKGKPFDEGILIAEQGRRVIASCLRMDRALVGSEEWRSISEVFACWTGTMTAYVEPNTRFRDSKNVQRVASLDNGHYQIYTDPDTGIRYLFPIYEEHLDASNRLLLSEHPNYSLVHDGNDRIVKPVADNLVDKVDKFPARGDAWYVTEPVHGIPQGEQTNGSTSDQSVLWRIDSRVGPVGRGDDYYGWDGDDGRYVVLDDRPSDGLGVAVEAPEGGRAAEAPQRLQVEAAPEKKGVVIAATIEQMKELVGRAGAAVQELSATVLSEKLEPIRNLLEALQIKE